MITLQSIEKTESGTVYEFEVYDLGVYSVELDKDGVVRIDDKTADLLGKLLTSELIDAAHYLES